MRCPQFGKSRRRANQTALPTVRGRHGKPVVLDVTAKHPSLGRTAPQRNHPKSRNDTRLYHAGKTPSAAWPFAAQQRFNLPPNHKLTNSS